MIHEILKILDTTNLPELEKQRITTDLLRLNFGVEQSEQLKAFIVDYISEFELEGATGWERYNEAKKLIKSI